MEAKLIVTDAELREAYLGLGGLGCFTAGPDPHSKGPVGGLIAYTVEDGDETWLTRIQTAMEGRADLAASDVMVLPGERGAPDLWSEAARPNIGIAEPIGIAHLVMRFAAVPL